MKKKFASIKFHEDGVILEGLSTEGDPFNDIVVCCQFILEQNFDANFIENEAPSAAYKRKISLYEEKQSNGDKIYWWEYPDFPSFSNRAFRINNLKALLVNILRNQIIAPELSNEICDKYVKGIRECSNEEDILSCLRKLLEGSN